MFLVIYIILIFLILIIILSIIIIIVTAIFIFLLLITHITHFAIPIAILPNNMMIAFNCHLDFRSN